MSRIGKKAIAVPAGVSVEYKDGLVTVKGPKGTLTQDIVDSRIHINVDGAVITLTRENDQKDLRAKHGLYRALIANMIKGVTEGYTKSLLINGIGYKVAATPNKLTLNLGYSHPIDVVAPAGITFANPAANEITVSGIDKVVVGQVAASIRALRKPEPYHGYGVQYKDEVVERKEGKAAGKK
ncbi:MAG: 50S ribosomal protein L6 [Clostridia bacterium]|nr:50S ribosomal protein L6 [Clostridia bacterium]